MADVGAPKRVALMSTVFPNRGPFMSSETSKPDDVYNCFAWAAEKDTLIWWDHVDRPGHYWPSAVARQHSLAAYQESFAAHGYSLCDSGVPEQGYEKIVFYADNSGHATHAAREAPEGGWSSKLGEEEDIWHSAPEVLNGPLYGNASFFMKRPTKRALRRLFQVMASGLG